VTLNETKPQDQDQGQNSETPRQDLQVKENHEEEIYCVNSLHKTTEPFIHTPKLLQKQLCAKLAKDVSHENSENSA